MATVTVDASNVKRIGPKAFGGLRVELEVSTDDAREMIYELLTCFTAEELGIEVKEPA